MGNRRGHNSSDLDGNRKGHGKNVHPKSDIKDKRKSGGRSWATNKQLASLRRSRDITLQQLETSLANGKFVDADRLGKLLNTIYQQIEKIEVSMEDKYLGKINLTINGLDTDDLTNVIPIDSKESVKAS